MTHRYQPSQDSSQIDLAPNPHRKTILRGLSFHFCSALSPYRTIIPLAGGTIDHSPSPTSASNDSCIVVFVDETTSDSSSVDTATFFLSRPLEPEVLSWVQHGWIPLAERELMRILLFERELAVVLEMSRKRREEEMKKMSEQISPESTESTESTSESTSVVESEESDGETTMMRTSISALKRPERTETLDDVEAFFTKLEAGELAPAPSPDRPAKKRKTEELKADCDQAPEVEPEGESSGATQGEVILETPEVHGGKGKRFVKKAVKKAVNFVALRPYRAYSVCL